MRLLSVNVSPVREIQRNGRCWSTGIFKAPVAGRVAVGRLGLAGDGQGDRAHHGGEHMAVYAYPGEHYAGWAACLGRPGLDPGAFGENLTTEGLSEDSTCIGDVLRVGTAVLQVASPRIPCSTLAMAIGDPEFPRAFLASGRVGFYLRVLEEGKVGAEDAIHVVERDAASVSVRDVARLRLEQGDLEGARRAMAVEALDPRWRAALRRRSQG